MRATTGPRIFRNCEQPESAWLAEEWQVLSLTKIISSLLETPKEECQEMCLIGLLRKRFNILWHKMVGPTQHITINQTHHHQPITTNPTHYHQTNTSPSTQHITINPTHHHQPNTSPSTQHITILGDGYRRTQQHPVSGQ